MKGTSESRCALCGERRRVSPNNHFALQSFVSCEIIFKATCTFLKTGGSTPEVSQKLTDKPTILKNESSSGF